VTDGHRPDRTEKGLRFGCGFVFIAPVVFLTLARSLPEDLITAATLALLAGAVAGVLATVFGDRFWERVASLFDWVRWW
jgi:hypothetical protein